MVSSKIFELKSKFVENAEKRFESEKKQKEFEEKQLNEFLLSIDHAESILENQLKPYCEELSTSFLNDISKLQKVEFGFGNFPRYFRSKDSGLKNSFFEIKFFYEKGVPISVKEVSYQISAGPSNRHGEITAFLCLNSVVTFFEESESHYYLKNMIEIKDHTNLTIEMDNLFFKIFEFHSNFASFLGKEQFQNFIFKKMMMSVT